MKISIVVLNWNGKKYLRNCFDSVFNQTYKDFEVIMVDNGSSDKSVKYIRSKYPKIKVIKLKNNVGFARGNNIGIKKAKGDYVLLLNNDTKLDKNFIKEIIKPLKDRNVGMISSKAFYFESNEIDTLGLKVFVSGLAKDVKSEKEIKFAAVPSGVAVLYKKEMLEDIKLNDEYFDEDYFAYAEDLDLGLRAVLRGWKFAHASKAEVMHIHSATSGKDSKYIQLLGHRNTVWTILKDFPAKTLMKYSPWIILMQIASIVYYFIKLQPVTILRLKLSAIFGIPKALKKRKVIQKNKKITAKEFEELLVKKLI